MPLLNKIQEKPYETRLKILWGTVAVAAAVLLVLVIDSIKSTISNAGGNLITIESTKQVPDSMINYAVVERVEKSDKTLKIYFNFNNSGSDILNVPKLGQITLATTKGNLIPQKITDRQGNPFVQKILSKTQNFGILFFQPTSENKATLIFDQMFLEKTPSAIFQQKIEMDLGELSNQTEVRQ